MADRQESKSCLLKSTFPHQKWCYWPWETERLNNYLFINPLLGVRAITHAAARRRFISLYQIRLNPCLTPSPLLSRMPEKKRWSIIHLRMLKPEFHGDTVIHLRLPASMRVNHHMKRQRIELKNRENSNLISRGNNRLDKDASLALKSGY